MGRLGHHNIISEKPGPTKYSKDAKTVLHSWKLLLSDDIISEIILRTNEKVELFRQTVDPKIFEGNKCAYLKETNAAETLPFLDSFMLDAYRDKILLEWSFYSQKTTNIRFFLPQCRKTEHCIRKRTDLQQFEIFLKNLIIIVENLSFRAIFFQLTKSYIPSETRWHSNNSTQIGLVSMAYYSKTSMHHVIFIHLFQRHTVESLFENQLNNTNLVPSK